MTAALSRPALCGLHQSAPVALPTQVFCDGKGADIHPTQLRFGEQPANDSILFTEDEVERFWIPYMAERA